MHNRSHTHTQQPVATEELEVEAATLDPRKIEAMEKIGSINETNTPKFTEVNLFLLNISAFEWLTI